MLKSILYSLLGLTAITGVVVAVGFVLFQLANSDVTVEQISVGSSSPQGSQDEDSTLVLSIVSLLPKDAILAILEPEFTSPQSAENQMTDTEQVIGVSIN